jgi:hypothetical protein
MEVAHGDDERIGRGRIYRLQGLELEVEQLYPTPNGHLPIQYPRLLNLIPNFMEMIEF